VPWRSFSLLEDTTKQLKNARKIVLIDQSYLKYMIVGRLKNAFCGDLSAV
jgi:hypothetical protein